MCVSHDNNMLGIWLCIATVSLDDFCIVFEYIVREELTTQMQLQTRKKSLPSSTFKIMQVKKVESIKYLGLLLSSNLAYWLYA